MTCPYGKIGQIFDAGVNPYKLTNAVDVCMNSASEDVQKCYPPGMDLASTFANAVGRDEFDFMIGIDKIYPDQTTIPEDCLDSNNMFFVQYTCVMSDDQKLFRDRCVACDVAYSVAHDWDEVEAAICEVWG